MLENFMPRFIKEMELGDTTLSSGVPGSYTLPLDEGLSINMIEIPSGIQFKCALAPFPSQNGEAFATRAMLANMFGQGTKGSVIGLTMDGNTLTLTQNIDYHIEYKDFRESLEDFINTVDFWRNEALSHK